jgi:hypothetical protein
MTTPHLHVIGIDPGGTTAYCRITVPRLCIFGDEEADILEWDYGEWYAAEPAMSLEVARLVREVQGLDYKTGPAVVAEQWDIDPSFKSTDQETYSPVRINAQLEFLHWEGRMGDATLTFQSRTIAFGTFTDARLKKRGLYVEGSDHIRAATKHALTALRRARENVQFAHELWPYPPNGLP